MRRLIEFPCAGETLIGTLDASAGDTGLLILSGGNELRCGAHRGMALLAGELAEAGIPVFRFDRRGVGDSTGANRGYAESAPDLAAAAALFVAEAGLRRLVAFGNCDAATALALYHPCAGIDALVLANPWTGDTGPLPAPSAIRARYAAKLKDPREWLRAARGGVDLRKLVRGLRRISVSEPEEPDPLIERIAAGIAAVPSTILLASGDNTAIAFADAWRRCPVTPAVRVERLESGSHSFAGAGDAAWLSAHVRAAIDRAR